MKKLISTCLALLFLSYCLLAQDVVVQLGPEFTGSKKSILSDILGYDKTGYYVLQNQIKGYRSLPVVTHFNHDLTISKQQLLEPKYEGKDLDVEGIFYMNDKIFLFTTFSNQKLGKKFLFYQTVNKNSLLPDNNMKKIGEIDFSSKNNSGSFSFILNEDTTKVAVFKNLPYEKDAPEKFGMTVYDQNMSMLWEQEVTLPYTEKLFDITRYILSNDGNMYVLGRLYDEKVKEKRKGEVNYKYKILGYKKDKTSQEYTVSLGNKFITDLQIRISDEGKFVCSGFYSELGTYSIAGTYFMKIDPVTNQVITQHHKDFPKDFLTQYKSEKETKKIEKKQEQGKDIEMYQFDLDELIIREDGGAYLIGEQYYVRIVTTTTTTSNGGTITRTNYYYNYHDIIVTSFRPDGSIEWWEKIPKRQVSANDGGFYSSYVRAIHNDRLHFIFNDNVENLDTWMTGKLKNYTAGEKGVVTLVSLGQDGKQKRTMLYKAKEIESITVPKVCQQISKNEVIIYGKKKATHQFSKLVFK